MLDHTTQKPRSLREDMYPENRGDFQNTEVQFLDRHLLDAFTAHSDKEVNYARLNLSDIQAQCLRHICWLSDLEQTHRYRAEEMGYDCIESNYNELVSFLSGLGESLAHVQRQLESTVSYPAE